MDEAKVEANEGIGFEVCSGEESALSVGGVGVVYDGLDVYI